MHEGKHIHYSASDQKPLCSFSGKVCNQRRLNHYGFCIRHILEDKDAPFKRCAYVAKSSKHMCTQPIPNSQDRQYCNNHMQVLGMLPKKERKPKKEKAPGIAKDRIPPILSSAQIDAQISAQITPTLQAIQTQTGITNPVVYQNRVKSRLTIGGFKPKLVSHRVGSVSDDPEDPYAFPADPSDKAARSSPIVTSLTASDLSPASNRPMNLSVNRSRSPGDANSGHSSLAKIYPELAEKLEKIKPKTEQKTKEKSKSSRTLNSLQTKIAQNKIKDKLKNRNQGSSSTSSQSQSPCHGFASANSPSFHINTSSPCVTVPNSSPTLTQPAKSGSDVPITSSGPGPVCTSSTVAQTLTAVPNQPSSNLAHINPLDSLNLQALNLSFAQLGLPVPTASDIEQTLKQLAKAANIPLDGVLFNPEVTPSVVHGPQIHSLPPGTILPTNDLFGLQNIIRPSLTTPDKQPPPYSSLPQHPTLPFPNQLPGLPIPHIITPFAVPQTQSAVQSHATSTVITSTSEQLAFTVTTLTSSNVMPTQTLVSSSPSSTATVTTNSMKLPTTTVAHTQPKQAKTAPSRSRNKSKTSSASKRPIPVFTLPMTLVKPRRVKNILPESGVKRLKTESARDYYTLYKKRKLHNHHLLNAGFDSSDDTSDNSDCDMLPWQPNWFTASSDEDPDDDDLEYDLRATKLALRRARLRRQCFQSRQSFRSNTLVQDFTNESTSALISAARSHSRAALGALYEVTGNQPKPVDKYKIRGLEKRKCCYKNDEDVQCRNNIVPYANHCMKHIMYNVDQQLFEYCTAKFADNTQCCVPVIDVKHELPLCIEHGIKADNYQKTQDNEPKPKRPRKKTKPSALTRPPKKGKKKKNQREKCRAQKPIPTDEPSGDTDMPDTDDDDGGASPDHSDDDDTRESSAEEDTTPSQSAAMSKMAFLKSHPVKSSTPNVTPVRPTPQPEGRSMVVSDGVKKVERQSDGGSLSELDNLGGLSELVNVKMFGELPILESASKLLEENDFQEVFNKLPDEAFDLFSSKNGAGFDPTFEEVVELEKSLAEANIDFKQAQDSFEQMSSASDSQPPSITIDEPDVLPKQIADEILSQTIGPEVNLGRSLCNSDAQESIKAIARSLSTSGMLLASEKSVSPRASPGYLSHVMAGQSQLQGLPTYEQIQNMSMQRGSQPQTGNLSTIALGQQPLPPTSQQSQLSQRAHIPVGQVTHVSVGHTSAVQAGHSQTPVSQSHPQHNYLPTTASQLPRTSATQPQNAPLASSASVTSVGLTLGNINFAPGIVDLTGGNTKAVCLPSNISMTTAGNLTMAPGNVILTPQNVIQQSRMVANAQHAVYASVPSDHVLHSRTTGLPAFPGGHQLSLAQLSQLIQQTPGLQQLQLPPLPPYTPRPPAPPSVPRSVPHNIPAPPNTVAQSRIAADTRTSLMQTLPAMSVTTQAQGQAQITQIQVAVAPGATHISLPLPSQATSSPAPPTTTPTQTTQVQQSRAPVPPTQQAAQISLHPVQLPFHPSQIQVHTTQIPGKPSHISVHPSQVHPTHLQIHPTQNPARPQLQVHPGQIEVHPVHNQAQSSNLPASSQVTTQPPNIPSHVQAAQNPVHLPSSLAQPSQVSAQSPQIPSHLQSTPHGQAPVQLTQQQLTQQQQHLQQQQQQLARQQEQLNQLTQQQHLLAQQLLQQHLAQLSQQGLNQLTKTIPAVKPPTSHAVPVGGETKFVPTNIDIPTTNIVWNPPPNVTLTFPNGLPHKPATSTSAEGLTINVKDTKIDLSHLASQLPAYHLAQAGLQVTIPPPPSYPTQTVTTSSTVSTSTS